MASTGISYSAATILKSLDIGYQYGFDIMDITGLPSGTVYPALRRMERAGLVVSKWENEEIARREFRPPRKYYEITPDGKEALAEVTKRYRFMDHLLPKASQKPKPVDE